MTGPLPPSLRSQEMCQIAIVVRNIEAAAESWAAALGVPKPAWRLTAPEAEAHTRYRGQPTNAQAKLAFFALGAVSLELIEPVGAPSVWEEHLRKRGEGMHHLAFRVADMDGQVAALEAQGIPLAQTGDFTGGRYAYLDGVDRLGVFIELLAAR